MFNHGNQQEESLQVVEESRNAGVNFPKPTQFNKREFLPPPQAAEYSSVQGLGQPDLECPSVHWDGLHYILCAFKWVFIFGFFSLGQHVYVRTHPCTHPRHERYKRCASNFFQDSTKTCISSFCQMSVHFTTKASCHPPTASNTIWAIVVYF